MDQIAELKEKALLNYALKMNNGKNPISEGESKNLELFDLMQAENDGVLKDLASVVTNDAIIRDSLKYSGCRVITFANILKYERFPLLDIINHLMKIGEKALGCPVEIVFAVTGDTMIISAHLDRAI